MFLLNDDYGSVSGSGSFTLITRMVLYLQHKLRVFRFM